MFREGRGARPGRGAVTGCGVGAAGGARGATGTCAVVCSDRYLCSCALGKAGRDEGQGRGAG